MYNIRSQKNDLGNGHITENKIIDIKCKPTIIDFLKASIAKKLSLYKNMYPWFYFLLWMYNILWDMDLPNHTDMLNLTLLISVNVHCHLISASSQTDCRLSSIGCSQSSSAVAVPFCSQNWMLQVSPFLPSKSRTLTRY